MRCWCRRAGCHYVCQSLCLRQAWAAGEICWGMCSTESNWLLHTWLFPLKRLLWKAFQPGRCCYHCYHCGTHACVPPTPCSTGTCMRLAVTEWAKPCFCTALDSESTWLFQAAGQNRTQGTPGTGNMHFIMCHMENRNKPSVTTKLSNNCLPQWAALHLASEDYFILVELIIESLCELYERKEQPWFWETNSIKNNFAPSSFFFIFFCLVFNKFKPIVF